MPDTPVPPARRPVGTAIRRTDEARGRAAAIDLESILKGIDDYHRFAAPGWQGLIEARPNDDQRGGPGT